MCVDQSSKAVLWERFEVASGYGSLLVLSFPKIERDPEFGPGEFDIPPDSWLQEFDKWPVHDCLGSSPSVGCARMPPP
jgi:hypothetical protein